jgi:hypothetical protein
LTQERIRTLDKDDSNGNLLRSVSLDPAQGAAFGLAVNATKGVVTLATVNDDSNRLDERFV